MRPSSIVFLNDFCIRYIQSEIESLVTHGASECWGTYSDSTKLDYGAGFANNCIHSGTNSGLSSNTVWYNYAAASANTIIDKNTTLSNPARNTNTAIESICPKGWSLPSKNQLDSNRNTANFNLFFGGYYDNSTLYNESTRGYWWGSEASDSARRYYLLYADNVLNTGNYGYRNIGFYIRCVSEEKTVTDLTYMQDITKTIKIA